MVGVVETSNLQNHGNYVLVIADSIYFANQSFVDIMSDFTEKVQIMELCDGGSA